MSGTGSVNDNLVSTFKQADSTTSTRTIVAKLDVDSEEIRFVGDGRASVSLQRDYQQLQTFADMHGPCFFLVKHSGKGSWKIYTYCPDSEPVKTKMLYSTAKDTLLKAVGPENFDQDVHASTKEELLYKKIEESNAIPREAALSKWEKEHNDVLRAEANEAKFRAEMKGDGIGGYHPVSVPLDQSAKDLLAAFKSGSANFVELRISPGKDEIMGVGKGSGVQISDLKAKLNTKEPRYYLFSPGANKFLLYLCPESSQIGMRMVYSTAKPSVADAAKACGIHLTRVLEASDVSDIDNNFFQARPASCAFPSRGGTPNRSQEPEWLQHGILKNNGAGRVVGGNSPSRYSPGGANSPSRKSANITQAHPTAQLLGGMGSPGGPKKKIVVPPSGAW